MKTHNTMLGTHYANKVPITLSLSFSFNLSMDRFRPSSRRSTRRTVSPDRVLNFFLKTFKGLNQELKHTFQLRDL